MKTLFSAIIVISYSIFVYNFLKIFYAVAVTTYHTNFKDFQTRIMLSYVDPEEDAYRIICKVIIWGAVNSAAGKAWILF